MKRFAAWALLHLLVLRCPGPGAPATAEIFIKQSDVSLFKSEFFLVFDMSFSLVLHSEQRTRISAASDFCRKEVTCAERTSCRHVFVLHLQKKKAAVGVKVTKVLKEPLP